MDLENHQAQEVEFAEPQNEDTQVSNDTSNDDNAPEQSSRPTAESQERNWRELERSRDEAKRRNQEDAKRIDELNSLIRDLVSGKTPAAEPEEEYDEDDIPNFGQTRKEIRREAEKIARQIVKETMDEQEKLSAPKKLKGEHRDFDEVVTKENIDYLIEKEPELATILRDTKDPYKQGKVAYKFIKALGLAKGSNVEDMKSDASRNMAKPVSPNAVAARNSVGDANSFSKRMTPELRKQMYQEMIQASKG